MSNPKSLNRGESEYDMDMGMYEQFPVKLSKERKASRSSVPTQNEKIDYQEQRYDEHDNEEEEHSWIESSQRERMDTFQDGYHDSAEDEVQATVEDNDIFGSYSPAFVNRYHQMDATQELELNPAPQQHDFGRWTKCFDDDSQLHYYFNEDTGESTWDKPEGFVDLGSTGDTTDMYASKQSSAEWGQGGDVEVNHQSWKHDEKLATTISTGSDLVYQYNPSGSIGVASSDGEADEDSVAGGIALDRNMLATAYGGLYRSDELLEDEEERVRRKFNNMKNGGAVMRSRLGWEEWLSAQGAIFYAEKGKSGGQWSAPDVFSRLDAENKLKEISKSRLQKKAYLEEEEKKKNAFSFMLQGWEEKRGHGSPVSGPGYENIEGLVQGQLIRDVFDIKHSKQTARRRGASPQRVTTLSAPDLAQDKEVTADMLDALEEQMRYDEYGNRVKLSDRYATAKEVDNITIGMKEIYRALRDRDVEVDLAIDAQALEKRTEKAKVRWQQYLEMKNERERSFFGAKGIGNDDEGSDEEELMNFTKLYSRSIIVGQKWPWTKLVDIETDRQFYRNEMEDYFQFAAPPEFGGVVSKDKNGQVKGTGAQGGSTDGKRRQGMMGALQETSTTDEFHLDKLDPSSAVYLREKFNCEITSRRKHFAQQNKIIRELEKGNTDVDVRALSPARRMNAALKYSRNMRSGPTKTKSGAGLRKNSIFFRGGTANQSAIEDLLPPEQYRKHDPEDTRRWRDLSDIHNNTIGGLAEEIGWHDCVTLLQRLRRFSDLRVFMDQMNGQVNKRGMISSGSGFLVKGGQDSAMGRYRSRESESMGPSDFVCGTTAHFRYVDRKGDKETLEDLSRMAAMKRVVSHHISQKASEVKNAVASFRALVDVTLDDDASCLENEITRRHLLEAAVLLKCSLTRPIKKRDNVAYTGMRTFMTSPHALKAEELVNIPGQEVIELQRWNVHIFNTNHLSASTKDPKPSDLLILYSKKSNGRVQLGVPFDLKFKQWGQPKMKKLRWYENGKMYSGLRYGKRLVDLMCDENNGILFYCPIREAYSWKKAIDASYYDVLSDTHSNSAARNPLSRKSPANLDGVSTESTEENVAKVNRIIKAHTRAYRSVAIMERRSHNVWADLDMTKPGNRGVSVISEESESRLKSAEKKPTHTSAKTTGKVDATPKEDSKFKINRFRELISRVLVSSYIRPSYTPPVDSSGPRITAFDEPDHDALEFEDEFTTAEYVAYADHIFNLLDHPEHIPSLLSFCEYLMKKNLGREVVMVLVRILEVTVDKTFPTPEDFAVVLILTVRLYCKFMSDFRIVHVLIECAELCPESPLVLSLVGRIFHALRLHIQAEELYVGALLLNPMHPDGLRGYGILLAEKGNYNAASRYLSRVDESSTMYHMAKLEFAWTLEILGNRDDAMLLAYQAVLSNGSRNRATSLTLTSMGHYFHVRGDLSRALDFYSRSIQHCPNNAFGSLMDACAHATTFTRESTTTVITTFSTLKGSKTRPDDFLVEEQAKGVISRPGLNCKIVVNKDDEEIDAKFRRGLFYLKGTNRWIALLSYAEFISSRLKDMIRAEDVYWESVRLSSTHTVYPSLALAHFYQYIRDDVMAARRVLTWASNQREIPTEKNRDKSGEDDDENDDIETPGDDAPKGHRAPVKNESEEAAVCVAHAYCHFSRKEYKDALRLAKNALGHDGRFAPALRVWGLVEWYQGNRSNALVMFKKSLKVFPMNPYCLRNYAVASALCGHYDEAVSKMKAAAEIGGNICSLAWRAAGQMSYIYDRNSSGRIFASQCFERAFELSGGIDMEAGRLHAQVLMELGLFEKAVDVLRTVLPLKPCDPVALGALGLCLSALGYVSPMGLSKVNYDLKIKLMDDPVEISRSNDPEELFEAATTFNLSQVFLQKSGNAKGAANLGKGWSILQNYAYDEPIDPLETHDTDVPPVVLYWYGMYCLQKGGKEFLKKAKTLFMRASQRSDYPPYLLALHKLGWLAETQRDIRTAERYYCYALQLEPVEPYAFLQLSQVVKDTHAFVSILMKEKQALTKDQDEEGKGGKRKKKTLKRKIPDILKNKDDAGLDRVTLQKRLLLHDRVSRLCELRKTQMKTHLQGLCTPGKFVYFEPFWLEQYMDCFNECEDWAWMLKCSHEFRTKSAEKKEQSSGK